MTNSETLHRLNRFITNLRVKFFAALLFDLASVRYTIVQRGVNVLANINDPSHNQKNYSAYVYEKAFLRIITPSVVWNEDFDWRNESLNEYCRRTEWRKELASMIIKPRGKWGVQLSKTAASDVF
jgi:hypothetical protein